MKILNLEQGSSNWLDKRRTSCTATDFSVICADAGLCKSIFGKSVDKLIKDKINAKVEKDNQFYALGRLYESKILDYLGYENLVVGEVVAFEADDRLIASLDSRNAEYIVEIKSTSKSEDKHTELVEYYKYQVFHQLMCCDYKSGILAIGQLDDNKELIKIDKYIINADEIMSKKNWLTMCTDFLKKLDDANIPPAFVLNLWEQYLAADKEEKAAKLHKENVRELLIGKYENGATFRQFSLTKSERTTARLADWVNDKKLTVPELYLTKSTVFTLRKNENDSNK
jgi:hypothetical protein